MFKCRCFFKKEKKKKGNVFVLAFSEVFIKTRNHIYGILHTHGNLKIKPALSFKYIYFVHLGFLKERVPGGFYLYFIYYLMGLSWHPDTLSCTLSTSNRPQNRYVQFYGLC